MRIDVFRVPEDRPSVHEELRRLPCSGSGRWIGRRMMDDPAGPEIAEVSCWNSREEMEARAAEGPARLGQELGESVRSEAPEVYTCRVWGSWPRPDAPVLLRIFRGRLVEGRAEDFDTTAMAQYIANFERNPRCAAIVAGIGAAGAVTLITLWTSWDAIVTATGGNLLRVLPVTMPGWSVAGSAVHYELIAAETRW